MYTVFIQKSIDFYIKLVYYIITERKGEKKESTNNRKNKLKKFKKGVDKINKIGYNKNVR